MKTLYKFIPLDSNGDYAFKSLESGILTATRVSKLREYYPEEMTVKLVAEKFKGKVSLEECEKTKHDLETMFGNLLYITCFTTNKDFRNEEKLNAYGKDLVLARYHDTTSINSKIALKVKGQKLTGAPEQVSYLSEPLDMSDYYLRIQSTLDEYIKSGIPEVKAVKRTFTKSNLNEFSKQLIWKPSSYSWENEWRLICKSVPAEGDRVIPEAELFPVVATNFYPSAIYYSPKFLSEDSHNFQRIKKFTSDKKIPLIKI